MFVAVTVNVYVVPGVNPVTVADVDVPGFGIVHPGEQLGDALIEYPVIDVAPDPGDGAVQLNCADESNPVTDAVTVNAPGAEFVVALADEVGPVSPLAFVADTVKL